MNYGEHKTYSRARYVEANTTDITDSTHLRIYNEGTIEISRFARLFPTSVDFTQTVDQSEYLISTVASDYLLMHESGMWNNEGTQASPNWDWLWESTIKSLDVERPRWRDEGSGVPQYYIIEGDKITIFPKPSTTLTDGLRLYYYKTPTTIDSDDDYPFGGGVEIPHMRIFDEVLYKYYRWRASEILRKDSQQVKNEENAYLEELSRKIAAYNERPDFNRRRRTRVRGGWVPKQF